MQGEEGFEEGSVFAVAEGQKVENWSRARPYPQMAPTHPTSKSWSQPQYQPQYQTPALYGQFPQYQWPHYMQPTPGAILNKYFLLNLSRRKPGLA
jgi:hypothetical protein